MDGERKMTRPSFLNRKSSQEDLLRIIDDLDEFVSNSTALFGKALWLDIETVNAFICKARAAVPEEVRNARSLLEDKERIIASAKSEAENTVAIARDDAKRIIDSANEEARAYVNETTIMQRAKEEADVILSEARDEATKMRNGANDYAYSVMVNLCEHVGEIYGNAENGCKELRTRMENESSAYVGDNKEDYDERY